MDAVTRPRRDRRRIGSFIGALLCLLAACVPQDTAGMVATPDPDALNRSLAARRFLESDDGPRESHRVIRQRTVLLDYGHGSNM